MFEAGWAWTPYKKRSYDTTSDLGAYRRIY